MSLESMLASLTPEEKLNAMDILWRDLSANPARLSSPDWHGNVLAHRIANPSSEPRLAIDAAFDDGAAVYAIRHDSAELRVSR